MKKKNENGREGKAQAAEYPFPSALSRTVKRITSSFSFLQEGKEGAAESQRPKPCSVDKKQGKGVGIIIRRMISGTHSSVCSTLVSGRGDAEAEGGSAFATGSETESISSLFVAIRLPRSNTGRVSGSLSVSRSSEMLNKAWSEKGGAWPGGEQGRVSVGSSPGCQWREREERREKRRKQK